MNVQLINIFLLLFVVNCSDFHQQPVWDKRMGTWFNVELLQEKDGKKRMNIFPQFFNLKNLNVLEISKRFEQKSNVKISKVDSDRLKLEYGKLLFRHDTFFLTGMYKYTVAFVRKK